MWTHLRSLAVVAACAQAIGIPIAAAQVTGDAPFGRPDAIVDLTSDSAAALVQGEWRYSDAKLMEVDHRAPGADLKASGAPIRTFDITPRAGAADFDDSAWSVIRPDTLWQRRSTGKLSFAWYRLRITIPERIGTFDTTGATAVFEMVVDDYAEVWVDGSLPLVLGQTGGALIKGFNAPNRVVVARGVRPGQRITIAVFAANGPLSTPPDNFIWVRSATLDFYRAERLQPQRDAGARIVRLDPSLDNLIAPNAPIEKLTAGFTFGEGPVWVPDGYLLFSDPNENVIYRYTRDSEVSVFRTKSGYSGADIARYHQPGSNGLALDPQGRLTVAEHGNRRITRIEKNGVVTVLADRYEGKRLNSPNDLVYRSDGALYFTDPPFGLPDTYDDPARELPVTGVFLWKDGALKLVSTDLKGPNGIAFSPDERYLYVSNWDEKKKIVMRYDVNADGTLANGRVFFDMTSAPGEEALDGVKVDELGNVYASGPGGVWIISPAGKHLGTIVGSELPANFAWGDSDRRSLYMTARTGLYRVRLNVAGAGAPRPSSTNP